MVADRLGDSTPRTRGRLAWNPLRHVDVLGTLVLPLVTAYLYQIPIGYARPVPIDPRNLPRRRSGLLLVGLAGPLASLGLAAAFGLGFRGISRGIVGGIVPMQWAGILLECLRYGVIINLIIGTFNFVPFPPLDGYRVLLGLSPRAVSESVGAPAALVVGGVVAVLVFVPASVRRVLHVLLAPLYTWLTGAVFYLQP